MFKVLKRLNNPQPFDKILFLIILLFIGTTVCYLPNMFAHSTEWKNEHIQFKIGKQVLPQFVGDAIDAVVAIPNGDGRMAGEHCTITNYPGTTIKIIGKAQAPDYRYLLMDETSLVIQDYSRCGRAKVFVSTQDFETLKLAADTSRSSAQIAQERENRAQASSAKMMEEIQSVRSVQK